VIDLLSASATDAEYIQRGINGPRRAPVNLKVHSHRMQWYAVVLRGAARHRNDTASGVNERKQ